MNRLIEMMMTMIIMIMIMTIEIIITTNNCINGITTAVNVIAIG